jgi:hypothetical protein
MLKVLVLSQRRSGSTFGITTAKAALGLNLDRKKFSRSITPYKQCDELLHANRITLRWKFWRTKTAVIKIEEPYSHFGLVNHLTETFPKVKAISTIRNIEAIVNSRMALNRAWAKSSSPQKILDEWVAHYHFLEVFLKIYPEKLFLIEIDRPENFSPTDFCRFLNIELTDSFQEYANSFKPINTLEAQRKRHKIEALSYSNKQYSRLQLMELFPKLGRYEKLYQNLLGKQYNFE